MEGRNAVVAGFFVLASSTACAPWGPMIAGGAIGGAATAVTNVGRSSPVNQPSLREVFRDGRYRFTPGPRAAKRAAERGFRSDPLADVALEKIAVKTATERSSRTKLIVFAIVWSDRAARYPQGWEVFIDGYMDKPGVELRRGTLRGVESAAGHQRNATVVIVDYAPGTTLMVVGHPTYPVSVLKDLARYLLRQR